MKAIAAYERTIVCGSPPWDQFQQGDASVTSDEAQRGWEISRGQTGRGSCHAGILLTDIQYHNVKPTEPELLD